ncbi:MAG TPA: hypothetical protein VKG22_03855 [Stellaceae bacterium]|nr:hypothetical protein [Stellaceae bacterium]
MSPAMSCYVYPTSAMLGDYLRAAAGFVPTAAILATLPVGTVAESVLSSFAAVFAVFGIRTVLRHGTRFEMTESALSASGLRRTSILWKELDRMNLAYYSTRRDRRDGWMQLDLRSGRSSVRLDSRIEGFAELVERAARAAETRRLPLNSTTLANLAAFGVRLRAAPSVLRAAGDLV